MNSQKQREPKPPSATELMKQFVGFIPHVQELGMEPIHTGKGMAIMRLP
ncbi:MAG: hypothetical protein AAF942_11320 [Pseudomonadota bacterium]